MLLISRGDFIREAALATLLCGLGEQARAAGDAPRQANAGPMEVPGHADSVYVPSHAKQPNPIRRVVTGLDPAGRAVFIMDGDAPNVFQRPGEGVVITELWETRSAPADNSGRDDPSAHPLHLSPPGTGSVFRIITYPPETARRASPVGQPIGDGAALHDVSGPEQARATQAPGFHTTNTVDYVIVLSGEIYALADDSEVLLRAGDVLIQRGTRHAWRNRSDQPARVAFTLIDANPVS